MKKMMVLAVSSALLLAGTFLQAAPAGKTNAQAKPAKKEAPAEASAPASGEADSFYENGKAMYIAGDLDAAKVQLAKALKADPNHAKSKKLMEKIGGGDAATEAPASKSATASSAPKAAAPAGSKPVSKEQIDRILKENINEAFGSARLGINQYMTGSIKEEISNSVQRAVMDALIKDAVKEKVNAVAQQLVFDEIERSLTSVMREYGMGANEIQKQDVTNKLQMVVTDGTVPYVPTAINEKLKKNKAKELYEKAIKSANANDIETARTLLEEAKALDPNNEDVAKALLKFKK